MIIEMRGVGFVNKGAELMMHAIAQQILSWQEDDILVANLRVGSFRKRAEVGINHLGWVDSRCSSAQLLVSHGPTKGGAYCNAG